MERQTILLLSYTAGGITDLREFSKSSRWKRVDVRESRHGFHFLLEEVENGFRKILRSR